MKALLLLLTLLVSQSGVLPPVEDAAVRRAREAEARRPDLPEGTRGEQILKLLHDSRYAEARALEGRLDPGDGWTPWAVANLRFHDGDYAAAAAALPAEGLDTGREAAIPWLRERIAGSARATAGMDERAVGEFIYRWAPGPDEVLVEYGDEPLRKQREFLVDLLKVRPEVPTIVEFLPTFGAFVDATGLPAEWVSTTGTVAIAKWDRMMVLSPVNMPRGYGWQDTLAHEYVHLALSRASRDEAPIWFQEGTARVLETRWRSDDTRAWLDVRTESLLAKGVRDSALIPFASMHPSMAALPSSELAALAFAQVAFAVDWIFAEAGNEGYRRIVEKMVLTGDAMRAVDLVLGSAGGGFEKRVRRRIEGAGLTIRADVGHLPIEIVSPRRGRRLQSKPDGLEIGGPPTGPAGGTVARKPPRPDFDGGIDEDTEEPAVPPGFAQPGAEQEGRELDPILAADEAMKRHTRLGDLLRVRGRPLAALLQYRKADEAGPYHSPALANKQARALKALGELDEAADVLRDSARLYPEYAATAALAVEVAALLNDDAGVLEAARRAIALNPFDPQVHVYYAAALRRVGDEAAAAREADVLSMLTRRRPEPTR